MKTTNSIQPKYIRCEKCGRQKYCGLCGDELKGKQKCHVREVTHMIRGYCSVFEKMQSEYDS